MENIQAVFLSGQTEIMVNGLHQWDYGRKLEIHALDLPAQVEVHFACLGMREATVRTCAIINGVGSVTIPNECLEQSAPIMVWIYAITSGGTAGVTVKKAVLNIMERARPTSIGPEPEEVPSAYEQLSADVNKQIGSLKSGEVVVAKAETANTANGAERAFYADDAEHASTADTATALDLPDGYTEVQGVYGAELPSGLYVLRFSMYEQDTFQYTFQALVGVFAVTNASNIYLGESPNGLNKFMARVHDNKVTIWIFDETRYVNIQETQGWTCQMMYKRICT